MSQGKSERERRLADMSSTPPSDAPWEPELPGLLEEEYVQTFPICEGRSFVQRFQLDCYGRLAEFAVIQQLHTATRPRRVAEYDAGHGELHVHILDSNENRIERHTLRRVRSYEDLEDALDEALDRVAVDWQENERRSRRGSGGDDRTASS